MAASTALSQNPAILDNMPTLVITRSTEALENTAAACQHALAQPTPPLTRENHISFLNHYGLSTLSRPYTSLDASRTWVMYWVLCALKLLGEDITPHRQRSFPLVLNLLSGQYQV